MSAILDLNYRSGLELTTKEDFMTKLMTQFIKEEDGATAIEYGLIASLIAVAIVGVLLTLGPQLKAVFQSVQDNLKTS
jgi:pilus assembly protein Flp/PilA